MNGSVRFHKKWKLWETRYKVGDKRKSLYSHTQDEAERKLNEIMYLISTGQILVDSPKFSDYCRVWLENHHALGRVNEKTRKRYEYNLKRASEYLGNKSLQEITADDLESMYRERLKTDSPNTVNDIHTVVKTMWKQALRSRKVNIDVPSQCRVPSRITSQPFLMDEDMRSKFFNACRKEERTLDGLYFEFLYLTGMRDNVEALELTWDDINFNEGYVRVIKSKTDAGRGRIVYLQRDLLDRLKEQYDLLQLKREHGNKNYNPENYMFYNREGLRQDVNNLRSRNWKRIKERMGVTARFRMHDLRHNFCSLMLQLGHPIPQVQKMVGHANPSITMGIYTHAIPVDKDNVLDVLDKLIPSEIE